MNERVKEIRKKLGLTLDKFGDRLGVGKAALSRIENGSNGVTEQMLKSICREFNVSEEWLRNGTGEMFIELDKEDVLMEWAGRVLGSESNSFQKKFVKMLMSLSEDEWAWLEQRAKELVGYETKD